MVAMNLLGASALKGTTEKKTVTSSFGEILVARFHLLFWECYTPS